MARCIDAFRSQLVRMRNVATSRRDDAVQEGQPIPSRTRTRPKVRRDPARSSSRRRRTTSGGRGGRSEAARVEGPASEGAHAAPVGQGEATSALRGGGMYEVGSSSQQPPQPQPQVDLGWTGPTLSFPPPAETRVDAGAGAGAGGEVTPRTAEFYAMMGLHPPTP
ncbi:uncharacterized protein LOC110684589 [Chenopodium quinoa]|uniref:uncharacterized protein LOC110684589 n=1 Tax=Chenopodium quinoa TaxID=63459 RepID=UPI000B77C72E|nr:uncharacterized protein LOC110684589 [Chenopodium quinoa]